MVDTAQITRVIKGASLEAKASFAFALGAKAEQSVLVVDRQKDPSVLLAAAKREGSNKACCGRLSTKGSEVTFETDEPLPGFAKHLNDWFKYNKLSFKADITGVQADAAESDDDDDAVDGPAMFQPDFVGKMLQKARRRPMNFAFAIGRSAEGSALGVHARKPAETLFRLARQQGGSSRGGYGNVTAEGKLVQFHCEESPAPGMRKAIRGLFKAWGNTNKVQVFGPEGEFEAGDTDEDDIADTAAPPPAGAADAAEPHAAPAQAETSGPAVGEAALAKLRDELRALVPELRSAAGSVDRVALQAAYRECEAAVAGGNVPAAAAQLRALRELLARQPAPQAQAQAQAETLGPAANDAAIATLRDELRALVPELRSAAGGADRVALQAAYRECEAAIAGGNAPAAAAQLRTIRELLARQGTVASGIAPLRAELDGLMPALKEAAKLPDRAGPVREAWKDADTALKAGEMPAAQAAMVRLRELALGATDGAAQASAALAEGCLRSSAEWRTADKAVKDQVSRLRESLADTYKADGNAATVMARFDAKLANILGMFDGKVVEQLSELGHAQGRTEQDKLAKAALGLFAGYRQLLGDKTIADIDDNPFIPLTIRNVVATALSSLPKELEAA